MGRYIGAGAVDMQVQGQVQQILYSGKGGIGRYCREVGKGLLWRKVGAAVAVKGTVA